MRGTRKPVISEEKVVHNGHMGDGKGLKTLQVIHYYISVK